MWGDIVAIIIIRTLIIYFALVIFLRLMGKRQLGEMELPELIVAVLIADMAATPLQDIGIPLINGVIPIVVLFCCEVFIAWITLKSPAARTILYGRPCFLIEKGRVVQKAMRKNRFTLDELTEELRGQSVTDISQVEYAVLETDGMLNIILYPAERPATIGVLGLTSRDTGFPVILINDGKLMKENLELMKRDERWLNSELKIRRAKGPEDVYLLMLDGAGNIYYAPKEP